MKEIILKLGTKDWENISSFFEGRTPMQCFYRWNKVLKFSEKSWTEEENNIIKQFVAKNGRSKWTRIAKKLKTRSSYQIKSHWFNDLDEEDKKINKWTTDDELKLLLNTCYYGTCWSKLKNIFPERDEISIKNKFYSILRRYAKKEENKPFKNIFSLKKSELIKFFPIAILELKKNIKNSNYENQSDCESFCSYLIDEIKYMYFCIDCKEVMKLKLKEKIISDYKSRLFNDLQKKFKIIKKEEISLEKINRLKLEAINLKDLFEKLGNKN